MTSASIDTETFPAEVDVWLDVGMEGRCFTYIDKHRLGVDLGDLVRVRLRGRPMNGLVVAKRFLDSKSNQEKVNSKSILAEVTSFF